MMYSDRDNLYWIEKADFPVGNQRPYLTLAVIYLIGVVYGSLLPFELNFARLGDGSLTFADGLAALFGSPSWMGMTFDDVVTNLLLYVPAGVLLHLGLRGRGMGVQVAMVIGVVGIAGIVWVIESMQALIPMRYASVNDWFCNVAGGGVGVLLAVPIIRITEAAMRRLGYGLRLAVNWSELKTNLSVRRGVAGMAWLMIIALVGEHVSCAWPGIWRVATVSVSKVNLMPFLYEFEMSYLRAAESMAMSLMWYAVIGGALWVLLRLRRVRRVWVVVLGVVLIAVVGEVLKMFDPARYPDLTELLVALIGALIMAAFLQILARPVGVVDAMRAAYAESV